MNRLPMYDLWLDEEDEADDYKQLPEDYDYPEPDDWIADNYDNPADDYVYDPYRNRGE